MRPLAQDVLDVLHHHGGNLLGVVVRLEPVGAGDVVPGAGGGRRGVEVALAVDVAAGLSLGAAGYVKGAVVGSRDDHVEVSRNILLNVFCI